MVCCFYTGRQVKLDIYAEMGISFTWIIWKHGGEIRRTDCPKLSLIQQHRYRLVESVYTRES